jgi:hypothetical protein
MAKPCIRTCAYELVVGFDLDLVAPVMAEMPPCPDHQQNAETCQRNPQISNDGTIGNETSYEQPNRERRGQQKHKRQSQNKKAQDALCLGFFRLGRVLRSSAGADDPVNTSRSPQPIQE